MGCAVGTSAARRWLGPVARQSVSAATMEGGNNRRLMEGHGRGALSQSQMIRYFTGQQGAAGFNLFVLCSWQCRSDVQSNNVCRPDSLLRRGSQGGSLLLTRLDSDLDSDIRVLPRGTTPAHDRWVRYQTPDGETTDNRGPVPWGNRRRPRHPETHTLTGTTQIPACAVWAPGGNQSRGTTQTMRPTDNQPLSLSVGSL